MALSRGGHQGYGAVREYRDDPNFREYRDDSGKSLWHGKDKGRKCVKVYTKY